MDDHPAPQPGARATIGGVLTDLRELQGQLPRMQPEHAARILDRLAEELAEAAADIGTAQPVR